jgi:hypothetical protein
MITGVAERAGRRIGHLVYVDALVPQHGESAIDLLPQPTRDALRKLAEEGGGWRIRPNDGFLDLWGLARVSWKHGLEEGPAREFVNPNVRLHDPLFRTVARGTDGSRRHSAAHIYCRRQTELSREGCISPLRSAGSPRGLVVS